jgi:hypothetical protein
MNKKELKCECGHTHISYVGDLGNNSDVEGYNRIDSCEECSCEKFNKQMEVKQ